MENKKITVTIDGKPFAEMKEIINITEPTVTYHTIPELINRYVNETIGPPFNKEKFTSDLISILGRGFPKYSDKIKIEVTEKNGFVSITPCNLYTFLQMCGVPVVYHLVEYLDEWYTPDGLYAHRKEYDSNGNINYIYSFTPSKTIAELRKKRYKHHD